MKAWTKVLLGLGVGAAVGSVAAILGKKRDNDDDYIEVEGDENCDSESVDEE